MTDCGGRHDDGQATGLQPKCGLFFGAEDAAIEAPRFHEAPRQNSVGCSNGELTNRGGMAARRKWTVIGQIRTDRRVSPRGRAMLRDRSHNSRRVVASGRWQVIRAMPSWTE